MEFIFTSLSIKRFIYLLLVTAFAFTAYHYLSSSQRHWIVWSALSFSLITVGNTFSQRINFVCILGLITSALCYLAGSLAEILPLITMYLFVVTIVGVFLSQRYPEYFFSLLIMNVFVIISAFQLVSANENGERTVFIVAGTALCAILQVIFWPHFINNEIRSFVKISLYNLRLLNNEIFSCFLQTEYIENIYLFERRIHNRKENVMQAFVRLSKMIEGGCFRVSFKEKIIAEQWLMKLEDLYENVIDYAQLRNRVTDHTVFSVCKNELISISTSINKIFSELIIGVNHKKQPFTVQFLNENIKKLEELYHNVMQVTAHEPLVFLLFIASLKSFSEEVEKFHDIPQII